MTPNVVISSFLVENGVPDQIVKLSGTTFFICMCDDIITPLTGAIESVLYNEAKVEVALINPMQGRRHLRPHNYYFFDIF